MEFEHEDRALSCPGCVLPAAGPIVGANDGTLSRLFPTPGWIARDTESSHECSMEVGEHWIYRLKTFSPSERVKFLDIEKRKQTTRIDIDILDGERVGRRENASGTRLQGAWGVNVERDSDVERGIAYANLSGHFVDLP